jgi:hypothetical protein
LNTTVSGSAHLTTARLDQNSLILADTGSVTLIPGGQASRLADLTLFAGTTLDIGDNALVVDYVGPSPWVMIRERIVSGRGGPGFGSAWTGQGIVSTTAANANVAEPEAWSVAYAENAFLPLGGYADFHGIPVDNTAVLITFTRTGDANLDGVVDDDDATIIGATYAPGVSNPHWATGDFDYNGFVDEDDVTLLGAFYDPSAAPLPAPLALVTSDLASINSRRAVPIASAGELSAATSSHVRRRSDSDQATRFFGREGINPAHVALAHSDAKQPSIDNDELIDRLAYALINHRAEHSVYGPGPVGRRGNLVFDNVWALWN